MSETTVDEITALAQRSFDGAQDPRFRDVMQALVRHAHAFVREVGLTRGEWERAIAFLTRAGQTCTDERQEFILLSDTLGISTLVDALNYAASDAATESTVLGPFFVEGAPALASGSDISGPERGERLLIEGQVEDEQGRPVAGAVVDVWQSNARGFYDVQQADRAGHFLRGRFETGRDGRFRLWSIVPAKYPIPDDGPVGDMLAAAGRHPYRPAHVHFKIAAAGYQPVVTQIFDASSDYLDNDAVFGVKPSLVQTFELIEGTASIGGETSGPWRRLSRTFTIMRER